MDAELAFEEFNEYQTRLAALPNDPDFTFGDNIVDLEIVSVGNLIKRHYDFGYEEERESWVKQLVVIKKGGTNNQTKHKELSRLVKAVINDLKPRTKKMGVAPAPKSEPVRASNSSVPKGITKKQKESLTQKIYEAELTLEDFKISVKGTETTIEFRLEPQLYFLIDSNTLDYNKVEYHHSRFNSMFSVGGKFTSEFQYVLDEFGAWLVDVIQCKHEIEAPDPWNLILDETSTGNQFEDTEEEFTEEEKDLIKERLDILEKVLAEKFDLQDEEIETLKKAVADMKAQLAKLNKPIWKRVAKTIVIDTVKDIAKNPETQHSMIETIRDTFENAKDIIAGFLN